MIALLLALCFTSSVIGDTAEWTGMRVKFGLSRESADVTAFFHVPPTKSEAIASGNWTELNNFPNELGLSNLIRYAGDYGFNVLYDSNGILAGGIMCQPYETLLRTGPPGYDLTAAGEMEVLTLDGTQHYCASFLIIDPTTLPRTEISVPIGNGLWIRDTSGSSPNGYKQVNDDTEALTRTTPYELEGCVIFQGNHYLYDVNENTDCLNLHPVFMIGNKTTSEIQGIGLFFFGQKSVYDFDWYEDNTVEIIQSVIADAPSCIFSWITDYTLTSMHVFFSDTPWEKSCDF